MPQYIFYTFFMTNFLIYSGRLNPNKLIVVALNTVKNINLQLREIEEKYKTNRENIDWTILKNYQ